MTQPRAHGMSTDTYSGLKAGCRASVRPQPDPLELP